MSHNPTIVALSSGTLPAGVAVIRLSGPDSFAALEAMAGELPSPRTMALRTIRDPRTGDPLDKGLVALFPAPRSFTGEDCAELHVHGSIAGVRAILSALSARPGIALAGPGDFTRRAFENGKLDLTAIEGLGDLIAAQTEGQRRQAFARLEGGLAARVLSWRNSLISARAEIEARLDFSDEDDVPFALPRHFADDLAALAADIGEALAGYDGGRIVREGFRVVLAGAPNAGKSSLLNALSGSDLAIVTQEAGTTRDTKDVSIDLAGQLVILTDTAGLRATDSLAEAEGIRRAHAAIAAADLVLLLHAPDAAPASVAPLQAATPVVTIASKADLPGMRLEADLALSARTGEGMEDLIQTIQKHMQTHMGAAEPGLVSHLRDRETLEAARACLGDAWGRVDQPELCAEDLRRAADVLAGLIGMMDSEAVLDRLFAGFCIGK